MILGITPISNVNYGIKNLKNDNLKIFLLLNMKKS